MSPIIINTPEIQNLFIKKKIAIDYSKYPYIRDITDSSYLIVGLVRTKDESLHVIRPIIGKEGKSLSYITDQTGVLLIWYIKINDEIEGFLIWSETEENIFNAEKYLKFKINKYRKINKEKINKEMNELV
jgi:hypothetical protein